MISKKYFPGMLIAGLVSGLLAVTYFDTHFEPESPFTGILFGFITGLYLLFMSYPPTRSLRLRLLILVIWTLASGLINFIAWTVGAWLIGILYQELLAFIIIGGVATLIMSLIFWLLYFRPLSKPPYRLIFFTTLVGAVAAWIPILIPPGIENVPSMVVFWQLTVGCGLGLMIDWQRKKLSNPSKNSLKIN